MGRIKEFSFEPELPVPVRIASLEYSAKLSEFDSESPNHHPERDFDAKPVEIVFKVLHFSLLVFVEVAAMTQGL